MRINTHVALARKWLMFLCVFGVVFLSVHMIGFGAAPADENYDDDSSVTIGMSTEFTNDGIRYILGSNPFDTIFSNDSSCPLGDDGTDYYMGVGTNTSVQIEEENGSVFTLSSISIDALSSDNVTITSSKGGSISRTSNDSWVTETIDLSGNSDFQNITSFTLSGTNFVLNIDDLDFEAPTYTVDFEENGGDEVTAVVDIAGTEITEAPTSNKTGYTLEGWYTEAGLTNKVTFPYTITGDVTLYAKWTINQYTVTLEENGGNALSDITEDYNTIIDPAPSTTKTHYTLEGWYTEVGLTNKVSFPYTITEDASFYAKWTADQHTVTLVENGGNDISNITQGYNTNIDSPNCTRTGHTLEGWYTDVGLTNEVTFPYTITGDVTLYAKWTINQYTVTLEENGGNALSDITEDYNTNIDPAPSTTKTHYTLEGWYTEVGLTNKVTFPYTIIEDASFFAKWTADQHTVTLVENGGNDRSNITQGYNTTIDSSPSCTRTGHTLEGWYTDVGLTNKVTFPYTITGDVTLYAKWTINQYTVTLEENGGNALSDITEDYNTNIDPAPSTTKTHYTLEGWYTEVGLTNKVTFPYTIIEDASFFAKWTADQHTVTLVENGGDDRSNITQGYNTTIDSSPSCTRTGYTLEGWYTEAGLTNKVTFPYTITGDVTLYAKWTINQYTVTLAENGGGDEPDITQDYNTTIDSSPSCTRTHYTLEGWYTESGLTNKVTFPYTLTEDATFYAKWTVDQHTVTLEENGGSDVLNITQDYNTTIDSPDSTKSGYTLEGWYTEVGLTNKVTFPYTITSDVTLYAKWTPMYTVSFEEDGGSSVSNVTQAENTTIDSSPNSTRTGYAFEGWYAEVGLTNKVTFPYTITGDATLYAKWIVNQYTVTLEENGGSSVSDITQDYDTTIDAPSSTKTGYALEGWYTEVGLTNKVTFPYTISGDVTLYAKWTANQYTVTLEENGGSALSDMTQAYDTTIDTPSSTRTGYTLEGWYTESGLTNKVTFPYTVTEDVTLYAKWTTNPTYTVSYETNGGSAISAVTQEEGSTIDSSPSSTKTGYALEGWYTEVDLTHKVTFPYTVTADITLYAKWTQENYGITYNSNSATSGSVPTDSNAYHSNDSATTASNSGSLARTSYTFNGWNTAAEGSGTHYDVGDSITITENLTLYAEWKAASNNSGNGGGGGGSTSTTPTDDTATVIVNGNKENAGTQKTVTQDEKVVTTVEVDPAKIESKLKDEGVNAVVTIPVDQESDVIIGQMTGQTIKSMETSQAVVEVKTKEASYTLPAAQIQIDAVSNELGESVQLTDIQVSIEISKPSQQDVTFVASAIEDGKYEMMVPPVDFKIQCSHGDKTIEVHSFKSYVERKVAIPEGIDPTKITTAVVTNEDGSIRHVPTKIIIVDGAYFAQINSLTNSLYTLIYNEVHFDDINGHWAETAIRDIGSRTIISGVDDTTFEPERLITRAEFVAIVTRGLGLEDIGYTDRFKDVQKEDWFAGAVNTATQYRMINGYEGSVFKPDQNITREEAMVVLMSAIRKVSKDSYTTPAELEIEMILDEYSDQETISDWARMSVADCIRMHITKDSSLMMNPQEKITRAETAVLIKKLLLALKLI